MVSFLISLLDIIKLVIASVTSLVFLAFSGLTFAGSAVALFVSTPLFIIFSPILVPATISTTLLASGLVAGTSLGLTAIGLIMRLIKLAGGTSLLFSSPTPLNLVTYSGQFEGSVLGKTYTGTFDNKSGGGIKWTVTWGSRTFSGTIPLPATAAPAAAAPAAGAAPAAEAAPAAAAPAAAAPAAAAPAAGAAPAAAAAPPAG
ncbi:Oleosin GRP-17 [Hirschfeldia incana]|nr:Oleosin GRP-17 [Hirschfeldia incana]